MTENKFEKSRKGRGVNQILLANGKIAEVIFSTLLKAKVIRQAKKKSATRGRDSCYPRPRFVTITDFTLHFSYCFTKLLHSLFITLLNNFTM